MKQFNFIVGAVFAFLVMCVMGADVDNRALNPHHEPVWRKSITQMTWAAGAAHTAQTEDIVVNGIIKRIDLRISEVSEAINVTSTITDDLTNVIFTTGAKADGASYLFDEGELATDAFCVVGTITITVDPAATDADEDMTVDIDLYGI